MRAPPSVCPRSPEDPSGWDFPRGVEDSPDHYPAVYETYEEPDSFWLYEDDYDDSYDDLPLVKVKQCLSCSKTILASDPDYCETCELNDYSRRTQ